jgi:hypothetical protein
MKKLTLLALSAAVFTGGLSATLPGYITDIYVTNHTDKSLTIGPRSETLYSWRGGEISSNQVGRTMIILPGQEKVKIGELKRDQLPLFTEYGAVKLSFMVDGQKQSFMSAKVRVGFASTVTFSAEDRGLHDLKLPLTAVGLQIRPEFKFGKTYQDIVMTFDPDFNY